MIKIWIIGLLIIGFLFVCGIMYFTKHKQCFTLQESSIQVTIKNNATYATGCIDDLNTITIFYTDSTSGFTHINIPTNQSQSITIYPQWGYYSIGIQYNGWFPRQHSLPNGQITNPYAQNPDNAGSNIIIHPNSNTYDVFPVDYNNILTNGNTSCNVEDIKNKLLITNNDLTNVLTDISQPPEVVEPVECTLSPSVFDFLSMKIRKVNLSEYELEINNLDHPRSIISTNCCGWSGDKTTCNPVNPPFERPS